MPNLKTQAAKELTEEETKRLIQLVEKTRWNYRLGQYEDAALKEILKSVNRARREIAAKLSQIDPKFKFTKDRLEALAEELQSMTVATQAEITGDITAVAIDAGAASYTKHNAILSIDGRVPGFNAVSVSASQLHSMVSGTPIGGHLLNDWVERSFSNRLQTQFKSQIMTGMLKGEGYPRLVKRFQAGAFQQIEGDITTLTRSYVQSINVRAMQDVAEANKDMIKGWKWSSGTENGSFKTGRGICVRCLSLDSRDQVYPLNGGPTMPLHPNCLVGETPVFAPDKRSAFVATYDGPVIEIGLTDGRRLTVASNHMFLTPQGFISAKLMRQGDKVFDSTLAKRIIGRNPNDHDSPFMIKNVVRSFSESFGMTTKSVPSSPEYLHSDGGFCDGNIDIITPDGFLRDNVNPSFNEFIRQFEFDRGDVRRTEFSALCNFTSLLFSMRDATDGGMGSRRVSPIFLRRSGIHHKTVGSGDVPNGNTGFNKSLANNIARDVEIFRYGIFGLTGNIPIAYLFNREVQCELIGRNSILPQGFIDERFGTTDNLRNVLDTFPGQIEIADVSFVRKRQFSGHVYDLQTFSSLYTANGLVSSNCRCVKEFITPTFREMGIDIDELKQAKRPYTVRGKIDPETGELFPGRVGTGGRNIIDVGTYLGTFEDFMVKLPKPLQVQTLGPGRWQLWHDKKVTLGGLTTKDGRLKLLKELED